MPSTPEARTSNTALEGQAAVDLWLQGRSAWNIWSADHPDANVSFDGVDFSQCHPEDEQITFDYYQFPANGKISFNDARFGNSGASFRNAHFGDDEVSFDGAKFGDGGVFFHNTHFGMGGVFFDYAHFGAGESFFDGAKFGDGEVSFRHTQFGTGEVSFYAIKFGKGNVDFYGSRWKGNCIFFPRSLDNLKSLSFRSCTFESEVTFGGFTNPVVIDLRYATFFRPIDLEDVTINFKTKPWKKWFKKSVNSEDSACFRCLNQLAKEADNHQMAIDFFAKEKRSAYWRSLTKGTLLVYYLYDVVSDYGRSICRPFTGLVGAWLLFSLLYGCAGAQIKATGINAWIFSLANTLPFPLGSHATGMSSLLAGGTIPDWVYVASIAQGLLSAIFIFLIGLAFRNLYRH